MATTNRQYDVIVFGASGYTGKLTAEHIATHLPSDLRWAIAGRSAGKLEAVAAECKVLNPNRIQPGKSLASFCHINVFPFVLQKQRTDWEKPSRNNTACVHFIGPNRHKLNHVLVFSCHSTIRDLLIHTYDLPWLLIVMQTSPICLPALK